MSQFLCLVVTLGCLSWFPIEWVDTEYRWLLGGTLAACLLGLWANTLWTGSQIDKIPVGLASGERKALLAPLLRRLWGAFVLALLLPFVVRAAAERFLSSPGRNTSVAERRTEEILRAQAAFVAQRKGLGLAPRAAVDFHELAPWIPPELLDGEDSGYRFLRMRTYDARGGTDPRYGFAYCAVPIWYGVTGFRTIVLRHTGEWGYRSDGQGLPVMDWIWADGCGYCEAGWTQYGDWIPAGLPEAPREPPLQ